MTCLLPMFALSIWVSGLLHRLWSMWSSPARGPAVTTRARLALAWHALLVSFSLALPPSILILLVASSWGGSIRLGLIPAAALVGWTIVLYVPFALPAMVLGQGVASMVHQCIRQRFQDSSPNGRVAMAAACCVAYLSTILLVLLLPRSALAYLAHDLRLSDAILIAAVVILASLLAAQRLLAWRSNSREA